MVDDIQNNQEFTFEEAPIKYPSQRIKVIGVGGGGSNAVNHMYESGARNVSFIVANTDRQALENSPVPTKVLLGPNVSKGLGAGNEPERACKAAEESKAEISAIFDEDTDMVFITAGMGGGTGTGAAPVIARIAKERGILTVGIVTIPFFFEGKKKILKALDGAHELNKYVDALLMINNERLSDIFSDLDFINAFGKADDVLSMAAMSISEIVTCNGYINLDFNDVDKTLRNGGTAIIASGYGEGKDRVKKAIDDAISSPLLKNTDIFGSKRLLFNLYFSREAEDTFKMEETSQINTFISNIETDVDVIWGVAFDDTLGNKVKFTILAAGFDVTLDEDLSVKGSEPQPSFDKPKDDNRDEKETNRIVNIYGKDKVEEFEKTKIENRFMVLRPGEFDDDSVIDKFTDAPALTRNKAAYAATSHRMSSTDTSANNKTIDFGEIDL